jgi:hypothetical protein
VYGLNWWVNGLRADGTRLMPDAPAGTYYAAVLNAFLRRLGLAVSPLAEVHHQPFVKSFEFGMGRHASGLPIPDEFVEKKSFVLNR